MEIRQSFISEGDNAFPSPPLLSPCTPFGISFNTGKKLSSVEVTPELGSLIWDNNTGNVSLSREEQCSQTQSNNQTWIHGLSVSSSSWSYDWKFMLIQLVGISSLVWYPLKLLFFVGIPNLIVLYRVLYCQQIMAYHFKIPHGLWPNKTWGLLSVRCC